MTSGLLAADWPAPSSVFAGTVLRDSDFELPAGAAWLKQVHGTHVVRVGSSDFDAGTPVADAAIASRAGDVCVVRTADCLPILLCAANGSEIAAVHAGWRGLAAGVAEATVRQMSSPATDLLAWFGPAISQDAFEVGDEVRDAFLRHDAAADGAFRRNARGRWQADLYTLARQRLARLGLTRISGGGLCTYADPQRFYSFRRDGDTGRLLSFVQLRP
jgi:purine-nucleoside/S-methyl-5'-thioadenosine phosphorylase / adenosine deaminase